jgi:hypothetical protein
MRLSNLFERIFRQNAGGPRKDFNQGTSQISIEIEIALIEEQLMKEHLFPSFMCPVRMKKNSELRQR